MGDPFLSEDLDFEKFILRVRVTSFQNVHMSPSESSTVYEPSVLRKVGIDMFSMCNDPVSCARLWDTPCKVYSER